MVQNMRIKTIIVVLIMSALVLGPLMGSAVANVPGVALNAPPPPPAPNVPVQGGTGLVKVVVSHRDTMIPATHYVDHVYLFDGNNLLKEWKYTEKDANPNEVYTESVMMPATKNMNLKAIAHCTLHGYNLNGVMVTVLPAGTTPAQMVQQDANIAGMQVNGMDPSMAASTATQMVQQDAQLLKQIQSSEMGMIQQHQMQTTQFFQTPQGQKFLDAFDYTRKAGAAGKTGMAAQGQAGQGQMMQGQQAAGMMKAPSDQGIPQTMWTDSMGNPMDGNSAKQMGQAAASMQQGAMAGQVGQGQMAAGQQGMMQGQQGMMQGQAGQGQMAKGQMAQSQQGMAR
jgi:desulfoferrodoxin (superoxide reductase-like protein)